jgi:NAD(P)-dependent dehydrogenase (short-subunit alcohol dehydrogenase family)
MRNGHPASVNYWEKEMNIEELKKGWDFTGFTIVVTGGTGVLGGEICAALAGCGAKVAVLARDPSRAQALLKRVEKARACVKVVQADVLVKETLERAREAIRAELAGVDALINVAGGNHPKATTGPSLSFFDIPEDSLRYVAELNLLGTILPAQVFGRSMAERGEGVILNISSMAAFRPLTRTVAYSASKAAVTNFTQWLAVHMAREYSPKIRVNALAPGFFHTTQNHYLLFDEKTEGLTPRGETIIDHTPMGRFGNPEDLLGAIFWLLSPASEFVTGAVIPVDGGFSAYSGV